jgi:hypothetical protein
VFFEIIREPSIEESRTKIMNVVKLPIGEQKSWLI